MDFKANIETRESVEAKAKAAFGFDLSSALDLVKRGDYDSDEAYLDACTRAELERSSPEYRAARSRLKVEYQARREEQERKAQSENYKAIRSSVSLDSVDKYLNSKHGLVLNNPAFTHYYIQYGEISTYPGGYKENAGIFCHNNAWIICAEAAVGRGDKAFEYYSKIAPAFREDISDLHRTEPYVYAQMIAGKDAKRHGEAKNSWLTGTAAWNFVAVSQYILGIKPEYNGLKIDPSIPHEWDGFTASRLFRGATYEITVKNPDHVCHGVKSVTVDGKAVDSNVIPVFGNGTHKVEVVLG